MVTRRSDGAGVFRDEYLKWGRRIKRQVKGFGMGLQCAPQLANLACYIPERDFAATCEPEDVEDNSRFIDDILTMSGKIPSASQYGMEYKSTRKQRGVVEYLGMKIIWNDGEEGRCKVTTELLQREAAYPIRIIRYPAQDSLASDEQRMGVVLGQFIRAQRICSHLKGFKEAVLYITACAFRRGYPRRRIHEVWGRFLGQWWAARELRRGYLRTWFRRMTRYAKKMVLKEDDAMIKPAHAQSTRPKPTNPCKEPAPAPESEKGNRAQETREEPGWARSQGPLSHSREEHSGAKERSREGSQGGPSESPIEGTTPVTEEAEVGNEDAPKDISRPESVCVESGSEDDSGGKTSRMSHIKSRERPKSRENAKTRPYRAEGGDHHQVRQQHLPETDLSAEEKEQRQPPIRGEEEGANHLDGHIPTDAVTLLSRLQQLGDQMSPSANVAFTDWWARNRQERPPERAESGGESRPPRNPEAARSHDRAQTPEQGIREDNPPNKEMNQGGPSDSLTVSKGSPEGSCLGHGCGTRQHKARETCASSTRACRSWHASSPAVTVNGS